MRYCWRSRIGSIRLLHRCETRARDARDTAHQRPTSTSQRREVDQSKDTSVSGRHVHIMDHDVIQTAES